MSAEQIADICGHIETMCRGMGRALSVEEIQDLVENGIMQKQAFSVAHNYITYRYKRALVRKANSTDKQILSLLECDNEEVKQENSNKNPVVNSVQRDYMAGEVSKDITKRFLLPEDIVQAHEDGMIHFHDSDYFAQHMHNCCLVNLEDMSVERDGDQRDDDRKAAQLFHCLQHCHADYRADCKFAVWRAEHFAVTSCAVCGRQPSQVPQRSPQGI